MKETHLQEAVIKLLKERRFATSINGISYFKGRKKASKSDSRQYSHRNILTDRYDCAVLWIHERLSKWDLHLVGNVRPTNISLDRSERLFPDIVAHDDCRNFFIFELKVGSKTEREAITELFAYIFELRTLMPNLNNHEISLIIISEEFGTLLSHAVLQVISFFGLKIMCLKPSHSANLTFEIADPLKSLGMKDYRLSENAFTVYSLCLYQDKKISMAANNNIEPILKTAENMLLDRANRLGSSGFYYVYKNKNFRNETGHIATYYLTIALLDPFKLLDVDALASRNTNISATLLEFAADSDGHLQNHFWELVGEAERFLEKFYTVRYEAPATYRQFSLAVEKWESIAISCNMWGEFGEFVREVIYASKSGADILNEELDHTNPLCLWEAFETIFEP
ncbi:hypothetical protein [Metapseudomonas otitidis]|uniref:hypothetical protein n=1 Tax=Metapseudomonas otitidis TaxID=319939 RepID=UPI003CEFB7E8